MAHIIRVTAQDVRTLNTRLMMSKEKEFIEDVYGLDVVQQFIDNGVAFNLNLEKFLKDYKEWLDEQPNQETR